MGFDEHYRHMGLAILSNARWDVLIKLADYFEIGPDAR